MIDNEVGRCTFSHDGRHEFPVGLLSRQEGQALERQLRQLRAPPGRNPQ